MARTPGPGSMGERLRRARRHRFVGRAAELELVRAALADPRAGLVLHLHGPGGVGKSSILAELAELAAEAGVTTFALDARTVTPSPPAVLAVLDPAAVARAERALVLLDTYEQLAPLDEWVRTDLVPALPATAVVVVAGRHPPTAGWAGDPAWRDVLRVVSVRNLAPDDASAYLAVEGVSADRRADLLRLSHGHPLTLSLLVDATRRGSAPADLVDVPDVVRELLTRVVDAAPSPRHRTALHVCARARFTTEELLRAVLGEADGDGLPVAALFAWLRTLSFVEEAARGLHPHDVARDALDADLRWRDPEEWARLHRAVRCHLLDAVRRTGDPAERDRRVGDAIFVSRAHPAMAQYVSGTAPAAWIDGIRPADRDAVLAMTDRHQGPQQAALAAHWIDRQPDGFRVFRTPGGLVQGYAGSVALERASAAERAVDPAATAMWAYAQRHGPPRGAEPVTAWRFFLDRDAGHDPSPSLQLVAVWLTAQIVSRDRCAWDFLGTYTDARRWAPVMSYIDFARAEEADYTVDGQRYAVFAHDWRIIDVDAWLERTQARDLGAPVEPARGPDVVLSQPEFADAVRSALRGLHSPAALAGNPLLSSQPVRAAGGDVDGLRSALLDAAATLRDRPRGDDLYRVLDRTFLRPAPTQEKAAELLHLSFSTYRRHRDRAVRHVVETLWEREVYGPGGDVDTR